MLPITFSPLNDSVNSQPEFTTAPGPPQMHSNNNSNHFHDVERSAEESYNPTGNNLLPSSQINQVEHHHHQLHPNHSNSATNLHHTNNPLAAFQHNSSLRASKSQPQNLGLTHQSFGSHLSLASLTVDSEYPATNIPSYSVHTNMNNMSGTNIHGAGNMKTIGSDLHHSLSNNNGMIHTNGNISGGAVSIGNNFHSLSHQMQHHQQMQHLHHLPQTGASSSSFLLSSQQSNSYNNNNGNPLHSMHQHHHQQQQQSLHHSLSNPSQPHHHGNHSVLSHPFSSALKMNNGNPNNNGSSSSISQSHMFHQTASWHPPSSRGANSTTLNLLPPSSNSLPRVASTHVALPPPIEEDDWLFGFPSQNVAPSNNNNNNNKANNNLLNESCSSSILTNVTSNPLHNNQSLFQSPPPVPSATNASYLSSVVAGSGPSLWPASQVVQETALIASLKTTSAAAVPPTTSIDHAGISSTPHPSGQRVDASPSSQAAPAGGVKGAVPSEFAIDIDRIANGQEMRTTVMVRNIPNKYTQRMLLDAVNGANFRKRYDFFYLPVDFRSKCNMGYAFINFSSPHDVAAFFLEFNGQKWSKFNSEKICAISFGRLQGLKSLISHFLTASVMKQDRRVRPLFPTRALKMIPQNNNNNSSVSGVGATTVEGEEERRHSVTSDLDSFLASHFVGDEEFFDDDYLNEDKIDVAAKCSHSEIDSFAKDSVNETNHASSPLALNSNSLNNDFIGSANLNSNLLGSLSGMHRGELSENKILETRQEEALQIAKSAGYSFWPS